MRLSCGAGILSPESTDPVLRACSLGDFGMRDEGIGFSKDVLRIAFRRVGVIRNPNGAL